MAKRKRCSRSPNDFRNNVEVAFEWVDLGQAFSDFGVPQLDNLMQSRKYDDRFTIVNPPPTTNSSIYNDKNMEDRISELPNNILHFILSFLETREGARTCILSTRWRYLWTESVSSLNLTYANMFGYDYPKGTTVEFLMNETVKFRQRVDQVPFGILSRVTHVETLFISGWSTPKMPTLHVLNNLKQLVFLSVFGTSHLQQLVYFLEACTSLQKLEIDMGLSEERNIKVNKKLIKMLSRPGTSLENLKEVEIYGFEGFPEKVQFARYLLKNATLLEKMKISSAARAYQGDGKWTLSGNIAKQGRMSFRRVRKLLQKETRSSTELIIESI